MTAKTKLILGFIFLEIIDFMPFPVTTMVALYIAWKKPPWFKNLVIEMYDCDGTRR
ncbi:MAG: hypothetical protein PHH11_15360 [Methylomonas sp.]|nr:hypothetical protein [Methylomonas sp.]